MTIITIYADQVPLQPWRNGGGTTRELLTWPATHNDKPTPASQTAVSTPWQLRITLAQMDKNGVFSAFPDVQRWYAVAEGAGVVLHMPTEVLTLHPGDAPLCYDGAITPSCALIDGPTQNLNIMAQRGHAFMSVVQAGTPWACEKSSMRGIFTSAAGTVINGKNRYQLPANTLHWDTQANTLPWYFEAAPHTSVPQSANCHAWWLGFSPADSLAEP